MRPAAVERGEVATSSSMPAARRAGSALGGARRAAVGGVRGASVAAAEVFLLGPLGPLLMRAAKTAVYGATHAVQGGVRNLSEADCGAGGGACHTMLAMSSTGTSIPCLLS